jgi:hypothetical protein
MTAAKIPLPRAREGGSGVGAAELFTARPVLSSLRGFRTAVALVVPSAIALLMAGCVSGGEHCSAPGVACAGPATYDLVVTEADSGKVGISTGSRIAFLLDGSRDHLTTSPQLAVSMLSDPYGQFPGQHAFAIQTSNEGIVDVTATSKQRAPFKFHLIVGTRLDTLSVVHPGDLVIEEHDARDPAPAPLSMPTFELVQDWLATGTSGPLLRGQPSPIRRAYRAKALGAQRVQGDLYAERVVVADPPASLFFQFVEGEKQYPSPRSPLVAGAGDTITFGVGSRIAIVFMSDRVQVSWTANPSDAVIRLPDADVGPQPPGATLIPFRIMTEGRASLQLRTATTTITVAIDSGGAICLGDDFPRYPLAQTVSENRQPCQVDMVSKDSQSQVVDFYRTHLNDGDWRVVSVKGSSVTFSRRSNPVIGGTLDAQAGGGIHVQMH